MSGSSAHPAVFEATYKVEKMHTVLQCSAQNFEATYKVEKPWAKAACFQSSFEATY